MEKLKHKQAQRLYDSLCEVSGKEKAEELLSKLPLTTAPSVKKQAEWACKSCELLCTEFDSETVMKIRKGCHCSPPPAEIKAMQKKFKESGSIAAFLTKIGGEKPMFEPDGETLYINYPECYCSFVKHFDTKLPREWCECTAGFSEYMFGEITGLKTHAELIESVHTGADRCRIKVTFEA